MPFALRCSTMPPKVDAWRAGRHVPRHREDGLSVWARTVPVVTTIDVVRELAAPLPRSYEVLVRDRVKFRVGSYVYLAFNREETELGFAFPKEERAALVESRPDTFFLPRESDLRYHWVEAWLDQLDDEEVREIVLDAWRMVVPRRVAAAHLAGLGGA
jgi:hypothetical protein